MSARFSRQALGEAPSCQYQGRLPLGDRLGAGIPRALQKKVFDNEVALDVGVRVYASIYTGLNAVRRGP